MNKNKKIVALICAMAMIFSMFASFTVVNAEEITKGIVLEYESSSRTADTAVVVAKAVGFEKVESYTVNINVPDGVTKVTAPFSPKSPNISPFSTVNDKLSTALFLL